MAIPVKKKVKILEAAYVKDVDSIVLFGECSQGRLRHQIHSSCFAFQPGMDKEKEMNKTAKLMLGKTIEMVFDPDLKDKVKDHVGIKY